MEKTFLKYMLIVVLFLLVKTVFATEYYVNSEISFNTAQLSALTGDVIIWQGGTYSNISISIYKNGLTVRAETAGGVMFNGSSTCKITGNSNVFSGFQYIEGDIGDNILVVVSGNHNKITQINFLKVSAHKYVTISDGTQYNEISYCNIENKPKSAVIGCTIQISTNPLIPGYHKIRYCSFRNFPGLGGDYGNEPIRIGLGAESTNNSRTVVEYCYFYNAGLGDSESISVKCCENVIRYCTFDKNPDGMLVFRNGNRNVAYGNFFINGSGGIRCKEANDIYCYNNYFETSGKSGSMDAITFMYVSPNLNNINFIHNTFVDCGDIDLGGAGPTNCTFVNNTFEKRSGPILSGTTSSISFMGNIIHGSFGRNVPPANTVVDPKLEMNTDGYYELSSTSPAINASDSNYTPVLDIANIDDDPNLMLDISGHSRSADKSQKDVGCNEYTSGITTNRPLKLSDVGPSYIRITEVEHEKGMPGSFQLLQNYPNPFNPETIINYSIPKSSQVSLKVYDLLGEEVITLEDEFKEAGTYNSTLITQYHKLSSGVYFYRLKAGEYVSIKKMTLLK